MKEKNQIVEERKRICRKSQVIPIVALDQKSARLGVGARHESAGDEKVGSEVASDCIT